MEWNKDALQELERVPRFVRGMARKAVEKEVAADGRQKVTVDDVGAAYEKYFQFVEQKDGAKKTTRIAVVRCEAVSETCPGIACLQAFNHRKLAFQNYDQQTELIGFFTCGGCPGRRISRLVDSLLRHGLNVVHLSSCMLMEGDYPRCPHREEIKAMLEKKGVQVVEGTHH